MEVVHYTQVTENVIKTFPYKGEHLKVEGVGIRWLSEVGKDADGGVEYGLRYFTVAPGGYIPIHKHFYAQTMFILSGTFECYSYDDASGKVLDTRLSPAGTSVFVPSMEPHGMKNTGSEEAAFICCICNVYEDKESL